MTISAEREPILKPFLYIIDGYGNFGHKRRDILQERCLATISRNPEKGADYMSAEEIPPHIIEQAQAVVVTIPDPVKFESVSYWLKRGKSVMVEKPFLANPDQLLHLRKIAHENKVIWHTAYNHRNEPNVKKIKELLEQGFLGNIYHARLCYGFGNAQQLSNTWRDHGLGALADVGCHLIDLAHFFFGYEGKDFERVTLKKIEWSSGIDHSQFITDDHVVFCEASMLYWKNEFAIDIFGEKGSIHQRGLTKWGESILNVHKRVLPAGVPEVLTHTEKGPDSTLEQDFKNFEDKCKLSQTSYVDDLRIISALESIVKS